MGLGPQVKLAASIAEKARRLGTVCQTNRSRVWQIYRRDYLVPPLPSVRLEPAPPVVLPLPELPVLPLPPLMPLELLELIPDELPDPVELFLDELLPLLWDLCLLLSSVDFAAALPVLPEEPLVPEFESLAAGMLLEVPEPVDGPEGELCAMATPVLRADTNNPIKSLFIYLLR